MRRTRLKTDAISYKSVLLLILAAICLAALISIPPFLFFARMGRASSGKSDSYEALNIAYESAVADSLDAGSQSVPAREGSGKPGQDSLRKSIAIENVSLESHEADYSINARYLLIALICDAS